MNGDDAPGTTGDGPVGQLPPQAWMTDDATRAVVAALTADGAEVRFVGGCVRDAVLRRPIRDIDIATHDPPERVMLLLERAGMKAIPTGIEHGTVTAVTGRAHFEITTLRSDVETFGRHARVEFTDDWAIDAARRDFTINALFCRPDGSIFDPFNGLADLGAGRVRFVGDAGRRIDEDLLRLLRFFRFNAHYGRPPPDLTALAACRSRAHKLPTLSGERVSGEIFKLLQAPDPAGALLLMMGERVLGHLLPEIQDIGRLRILTFLETRGIVHPWVAPDALRRLAAALTVDAAGARAVAARLKLSTRQSDRLTAMAAPAELPDPGLDAAAARRLLYRLGDARLFVDLLLLAWAGRKAVSGQTPAGETDRWRTLLDLATGWTPPVLPLRGQDILDLGVPRGPRIGALLAEIEGWWIDGDFSADRRRALERLRQLVETSH
ncbi:MAG TPA: CCA tRNA nucleotidyltransferase [Rhodospirillaceae bacterium]|nr:CCA tRNA nucleotidyltransferase [Rhodospirillaceae bacterium]